MVQRARIDLAETQRIPDVSFELSYRRIGDVENTVDVGVRVPIPLFNRYQGRIREARADFVAPEARARSVRNALTLELQTAYRTLASAIAAAHAAARRDSPTRRERLAQRRDPLRQWRH